MDRLGVIHELRNRLQGIEGIEGGKAKRYSTLYKRRRSALSALRDAFKHYLKFKVSSNKLIK